jgi:hypothetical protein
MAENDLSRLRSRYQRVRLELGLGIEDLRTSSKAFCLILREETISCEFDYLKLVLLPPFIETPALASCSWML